MSEQESVVVGELRLLTIGTYVGGVVEMTRMAWPRDKGRKGGQQRVKTDDRRPECSMELDVDVEKGVFLGGLARSYHRGSERWGRW